MPTLNKNATGNPSIAPWQGLQYRQVDVFANEALSGNGVAVFWNCGELSKEILQELTKELRQFEAIYLRRTGAANQYRANVFTMEEELDFAGHPVLGAAAVLHEKYGGGEVETWHIALNANTVEVITKRTGRSYLATMYQQQVQFLSPVLSSSEIEAIMHAVNLSVGDKHPVLPLEVGSTGLPYLIVPVIRNLDKARIVAGDLEETLRRLNARFLYLYDVERSEGRNWDNKGLVEDIATGSAAGPVAAYLCRHGLRKTGENLRIKQGIHAGRPSEMVAKVLSSGHVEVSGGVQMVATGTFD
jgi:trans-2,3-dihydro-3-hydroxyanthranilate isomerase